MIRMHRMLIERGAVGPENLGCDPCLQGIKPQTPTNRSLGRVFAEDLSLPGRFLR
jgi:hypothetical protein